jgi:peroxiredoxin Q/BCP
MKLGAPLALLALVTTTACTTSPQATTNATSATSAASSAKALGSSAQASTAQTADAPLKEGDMAPELELTLQSGKKLALSSLRGKFVAVYFYPKDDTPGCTVEAQGIRDRWEDLAAANVTVLGVSLQDASSHQQFIDKYKLPFDLVVDSGGAVAKAFRVPVRGEYASRQTFLVGPDGRLKKIWFEVKPNGHAAEILAAAKP